MNPLRIASRVRQWAVLGSKANIAQYGFQKYLRTGNVDPTAEGYLKEGLGLFSLLKEGQEVTQSGRITAAHQLAAVNALEPIKPPEGAPVLEASDIKQIVETIEAILKGERPSKEVVEICLEKVLNTSDAYADFAFKELDVKEKAYLRPAGVRA